MFRNVYAIVVSFMLMSLSAFAYGQEAQIQGQVLDTTGAAVPKALVHIENQQTSTERKVESSDTGQYSAPGLTPGLYKIIVEASGFSSAVSNPVMLNAGQTAVVDFSLKVGSTASDVVVTADKREERSIDVPGSVTALQAEPLVSNGQVLLRDYYTQVPGFSVSPNYNADQVLSIRGISTAGSSNPTVGVLVDDAPYASRNSVPDIDPEDLARIEVLRGPQGTLYGANSMGGLINYITADPSTSKIFGRVQAGTSATVNGAEPGYDLRGSLNFPFNDKLAVRVSAFRRQDPGYIDNTQFNLRGVNQTQAGGGRLVLLWKPNEKLGIRLSGTYQDSHAAGGTEEIPTLGRYKTNLLPTAGGYSYRPQIYNGQINYQFSNLTLTSISSYARNSYTALTDFTSSFGQGLSGVYNQNPGILFDYTQPNMYRITQEARLASGASGLVEWMIGGFGSYLMEPNIWFMDALSETTGDVLGRFWDYTSPTETQEYGIFANAKVKFSDRFNVQVGAREARSIAKNLDTFESGPAITIIGYAPPFTPGITSTADKFTYMAAPTFYLAPDVMIYARVATGFRPPVPNPPDTVAQGAPATVHPDTTTNYEAGLKGDFLQHRLTIEAAAYWIEWSDIQIQLSTPSGFSYYGNGSGARSRGFELTAGGRPVRSLSLNGWVSYDDAKITKDFAFGVPGDKLPFAPQVSAHGSAEQNFARAASWTAYLGGDVSYIGSRSGIFIDLQTPQQTYPSYTKADIRLGMKSDLWRAELYSTNLSNSRGQLNGGQGYAPTPEAFIFITPRTVGLSVERKF